MSGLRLLQAALHGSAATERRLLWLVWLVAIVVCVCLVAAFHDLRADDAYISYRYGQNLASGIGPVFNPGQRVQGSTSPGHVLLSALVYAACGASRMPSVLAAIGCMGWTLQCVALYLLLARSLGALGASLIAFAIALGVAGSAAWVPFETHLVAAGVLFAFVCVQRQRWQLAATCCALAVLFRPDAWLVACVLALVGSLRLRGRIVRPVLSFCVIALPWPMFASVYYGSPIPQSAVTKFQRTGWLEYVTHELSYPSLRLLWSGAPTATTLVGLALAALGAWRLWRGERTLALLVAYGVLHAAAYLVLRPFTAHTWHLYPWTLVYCVCVLAALTPPAAISGWRALHWAQTALFVAMLGLGVQRFVSDCHGLARGYWTGQRDLVYQRIAHELRARAAGDDWFAAVEVGTLAFYAQLPAYDLGGLITRRDDSLYDHPVRFVVLDKAFLAMAPPRAPVFSAREGEFWANLYDLKPR